MAKNKTRKLTTMAMLFALAIVLSFVESLIAPMFALPPGVKLGLGNIVVMYCMVYMGYSSAFQISALKGLFAFLTRGFTAGVLSFTGGIFSITIMYLLKKLFGEKINYHTLSVFGALFHNIGQLTAFAVMFTNAAPLAYLPVLTVSAVVMGLVTGSTLKVVIPALKRL
ncbi:MAG: Gx transporter family protein [Oscillospiraceae bacterium]|nr:Gx transporter family protein [Oscillospiraceae bacterium]